MLMTNVPNMWYWPCTKEALLHQNPLSSCPVDLALCYQLFCQPNWTCPCPGWWITEIIRKQLLVMLQFCWQFQKPKIF